MALGCVPVSRKSIEAVLNSGPGRSAAIVIGGGVSCARHHDVIREGGGWGMRHESNQSKRRLRIGSGAWIVWPHVAP
jgi:hypothetical protein